MKCERCGNEKFFPIPDSIAIACEECGFVLVRSGDGYEPGATIGQWLEDVFGVPNTIDKTYEPQGSPREKTG